MLAPINNFTNMNKNVSFKSRWFNGQYYSDEQEKIAERIAKIRRTRKKRQNNRKRRK